MKATVTLKELTGTKIICAALLACCYWMWARRDWMDFYAVVQHGVTVFTIVFFAIQAGRIRQYGKQEKDEQAVRNLRRIDALVLKIMAAANIITAFSCAVTAIDGRTAGYALVGTVFVLTVLRFILFCMADRKDA